MQQENNELLSKFNEAGAQLFRIGNLWTACHYYRKRGNLSQWNVHLDSVWLELSADAKPEHEKKINNFNSLILKYKGHKDIVYQILMKKEMFLRKLQNAQGKGSTYQDPDADDM